MGRLAGTLVDFGVVERANALDGGAETSLPSYTNGDRWNTTPPWRWNSPADASLCPLLSGSLNTSHPVLLIKGLTDEGLDHSLAANV